MTKKKTISPVRKMRKISFFPNLRTGLRTSHLEIDGKALKAKIPFYGRRFSR